MLELRGCSIEQKGSLPTTMSGQQFETLSCSVLGFFVVLTIHHLSIGRKIRPVREGAEYWRYSVQLGGLADP